MSQSSGVDSYDYFCYQLEIYAFVDSSISLSIVHVSVASFKPTGSCVNRLLLASLY
jgi:hypothetical protein